MDAVLVLAGFLALLALYVGVIWLVRRIVKGHVREGHNDVLVPLFLTAGTLYAVLLAFLVIAVWEQHDAASDNAAEEASTLATMYRQTAGMPSGEQRTFRALLRGYTNAVVDDEWPVQAKNGGASPKARHYIAEIYRAYGALPPAEANSPVSQEFLRTFSTVAADRNRRTLQANEQLPDVLWAGLLVGGGIVIGMSFFLYMETFWLHAFVSGSMATLIGFLLLLTLLMNQPFTGPLALDSGAFEHSTTVFDSVDKGD